MLLALYGRSSNAAAQGGSFMKCAFCKTKECHGREGFDCSGRADEALELLEKPENREIFRTAAHIEATGYMKLTRLEEMVRFARKMGWKRLGIAFCIGLAAEAEILHRFLAKEFEVYSVCCKVCGLSKDELGLPKIVPGRTETACDPVGQALVLADKETEMNIILGLCVGHDMLFARHSKAPVTTLVAKDRVLAHNPIGALYSRYYKRKLEME
jgi:uncharacterized metal-binding protein